MNMPCRMVTLYGIVLWLVFENGLAMEVLEVILSASLEVLSSSSAWYSAYALAWTSFAVKMARAKNT